MGAAVLMGIAAGASLMEGMQQEQAQEEAQQAQEQALKRQMTQEKIAASEQQISRDNKLMQIQSQQEATAASKGMALSSGTFTALSDESYNNFARATKVGNLNLQAEESDINSKIAAGRSERNAQKWGNYLGMISSAARMGYSASQVGQAPKTSGVGQAQGMNENEYDHEMDKTWNTLNNPGDAYSNWLRSSQNMYE
mgnify:CR=1 FL=1|tara:strand:- start:2458 stop:3048 length:591 start_codon:yes stop_codon:yes gene_type:complete